MDKVLVCPEVGANTEVDQLLAAWRDGDRGALDRLITVVIDEIYQLARKRFDRERENHTLQPTALVSELYLRLVNQREAPLNRLHFFATAALTIKRILIDHARRKTAKKKGERVDVPDLDEALSACRPDLKTEDLLGLEEALGHLEQVDAELSRIVHLHFFLGMTYDEISDLEGKSPKWVRRRWELARAYLLVDLQGKEIL